MSVFITANGKRRIECNVCGATAESIHGNVYNGVSNDIAPFGDTENEEIYRDSGNLCIIGDR